jgi:zinc/manganese transport system permease protein
MTVIHHLFEPGFFASGPVHTALVVSAIAALVAGPLGVFTVLRGQSFAGEALGDIGTTGGSGAYLVGVGPLWGFLVINVAAVTLMELIGVQRRRGRDLATGIVLGAGLGLAALFLYLAATRQSTTGAAVSVLFGSLFSVSATTTPLAIAVAAVVLALLMLVGRPLLLASANPELAAARGIPVRLVGYVYLLALSLAVALCALTIGSILSTALLIGPAASALRICRRPARAILASAGLGITAAWIGILLAYDSYAWPPHHQGWPVSFFVVALVLVIYLGCGTARHLTGTRRRQARVAGDPAPGGPGPPPGQPVAAGS